jgi:Suppressor of fused protein (SUFU)
MTTQRLDFSKLPDVSALHPELEEAGERPFAAHMKAREDALLAIFGESEPPDQILSPDDPDLTISWPGGGVYQYPPRGERRGFHYVTHGLSQPFEFGDDEDEHDDEGAAEIGSGMGIELVISTPERCDWAPSLLLEFVKYLLFNENARVFEPGHRIPASALRAAHPESELTHLFGIGSPEYPHEIMLPGGSCTLVHLVGATTEEIERAKALGGVAGTFILADTLRELGIGCVTDLARRSATADERFEALWGKAVERHASDE